MMGRKITARGGGQRIPSTLVAKPAALDGLLLARYLARYAAVATFNMHDAKTQLSDLVARAEAGEDIVIARRNKPAVRLVRVDEVPAGFGEERQAGYDAGGLREALDEGREFTIMKDGKVVAKVVPVESKQPRVPGRFAHLRGNLPPDLFDQPLSEDELEAWDGKYSGDHDLSSGG
jgi:prevent-host-death family protein